MKYASFRYDLSSNLGDEIQTLATEPHLPKVDTRIDRDSLASFEADEVYIVVFQGWFTWKPQLCFPPSRWIVPAFIGFHLNDLPEVAAHILSPDGVKYLKQHEPIGCRDEATRRRLEQAGIAAYTSHCLTLTFPRRAHDPEQGRVFVVDGENIPIPRNLCDDAVWVSQTMSAALGDEVKSAAAARLLEMYRDQARLVITTRLHCALPCLAMGIPVVFFGDPDDGRLGILRDLHVPINRPYPRSRLARGLRRLRPLRGAVNRRFPRTVDWEPPVLDIEDRKSVLREDLARAVRRAEETARSL
jgi:hypothetical protein